MSTKYGSEKYAVLPKGVVAPEKYNSLPTPYKEISADEFWHKFSVYGIGDRQAYDQVYITEEERNKRLTFVHIFWHHDCGIAVAAGPRPWHCRDEKTEGPGFGIVYDAPIRYFRIGCDHKYKSTYKSKGPHDHWNEYTCEDCGAVNAYDSSG